MARCFAESNHMKHVKGYCELKYCEKIKLDLRNFCV